MVDIWNFTIFFGHFVSSSEYDFIRERKLKSKGET